MAFKGWSDAAVEFYDGLEEDNSKAYWQAHKAVYDSEVKGPMEALLAELAEEFGPGRMFRPNRDIRFSADKSPYKTTCSATLESSGYIQFSAAGLAAARGMYAMAGDQLQRFRHAVAAEHSGADLAELVASAAAQGIGVEAIGRLSTAPRGFPRDHPRIDLLRLKGLVTWREWPVGPWLSTAKAKTRVVTFLRASEPIIAWLDAQVGPSTEPEATQR